MSNGARCCLIGLCCSGRAQKVTTITDGAGVDADAAGKLLDWLEAEEIGFAPASFGGVMQEIAEHARKHPKPA